MKKLMLAVLTLTMAASAHAAVSFEFGSSWFFPRIDQNNSNQHLAAQGQTFAANWDLENDLILGVFTETGDLNNGLGNNGVYNVSAVAVSKGVMKNASVGLRLGRLAENYNGSNAGMLTDLVGSVTLVSGAADKISGSLKANFGGRFANIDYSGGDDLTGYFVAAAVGLGF